MINRSNVVSRHDPTHEQISYEAPLTVGNGEFAYTVDVTGMQTLYHEHLQQHTPLCTMSQWGWHTTPVSQEQFCFTMDDLQMTTYDFVGRQVSYAVEAKPGNEEAYHWLRHNPHRLNLGKIGFLWMEGAIEAKDLSEVHQTLNLYEGIIQSDFVLHGYPCRVLTVCDPKRDVLAFEIQSKALLEGLLSINLDFPYGSSDISASDWNNTSKHQTAVVDQTASTFQVHRRLDQEDYFVQVNCDHRVDIEHKNPHQFIITAQKDTLSFTVEFNKEAISENQIMNNFDVKTSSQKGWKAFWETGAAIDFSKAKDARAFELERRIVLSQYVSAIQSCGSLPPQETGLTCNSWYGKFHLEMHLWHSAYLPLWQRGSLLKRSLPWYKEQLPKVIENAKRNGFKGARWPKMVAYDAVDSPSWIATLLVWQQPHIIYMLELLYACESDQDLLIHYWDVVEATADFMCDFAVYNVETRKYDLRAPLIPAQEEHDPRVTLNPLFEVEYWRFTLTIAVKWAMRLGYEKDLWVKVSENMADLPVRDGLYMAHENCPNTFDDFKKDHPSMLAALGVIASDRVSEPIMLETLKKVLACWDYTTLWGWDFALMAMTCVRLGQPEMAIDILLKETPKNSYVMSGNNYQKLRTDLPLYLPGNGSLLLAIAMMAAGYKGCTVPLPGFPKNGLWELEFEDMHPFPY